jgi:hypothetical protein
MKMVAEADIIDPIVLPDPTPAERRRRRWITVIVLFDVLVAVVLLIPGAQFIMYFRGKQPANYDYFCRRDIVGVWYPAGDACGIWQKLEFGRFGRAIVTNENETLRGTYSIKDHCILLDLESSDGTPYQRIWRIDGLEEKWMAVWISEKARCTSWRKAK